jgi:hypothetical protein
MPGPESLLAWLSITILHLDGWQLTDQTRGRACARHNFNPRYSIAIGCSYMHVSNLYLSFPKYDDHGMNVYGPMIGFNMRLGKRKNKLEN